MNTAFSCPTLRLRIIVLLCLALVGCATPRVNWAARVGHYTYEQAVTDLGPPDKQAQLDNGTRIAEWLTLRGYTYTYGSPGPYGPFYGGNVNTYTAPSQFLRLAFGTNGQLTAWKNLYK